MLSYALPPTGTPGVPPTQSPPVVPLEVPMTTPPSDTTPLQLELAKTSSSPGPESEVETPASDRTDKSSKGSQIVSGKVIANGAKPTVPLKRVSFGSSKGSMVETLIYESPLHEEPEPSPIQEAPPSLFVTDASANSTPQQNESEPSQKVRVSFFESSRPQQIPGDGSEAFSAPDALLPLRLDAAAAAAAMAAASLDPNTPGPIYVRQGSTDSGWDNPFRPDGDLSREADEIVELIKGGKPITPTPNSAAAAAQEAATIIGDATDAAPEQRNGSAKVNGAATKANATPLGAGANAAPGGSPSGPVDVHRATVAPAGDVEHVVLKKKPKCKCCVIQ